LLPPPRLSGLCKKKAPREEWLLAKDVLQNLEREAAAAEQDVGIAELCRGLATTQTACFPQMDATQGVLKNIPK